MSTIHSELLPTRETLLSRLRSQDDQTSWREFFHLYWQLIYALARRRGLNEEQAQDAVQETIIAVAQTMPGFRYEPQRCSFKSWLRHLAEKKIADQFRKRARANREVSLQAQDTSLPEALENLADPAALPPDETWDRDWERHLFDTALEIVKRKVSAQQFRIFHRNVVLGFSGKEVAATLRVSLASVYLAKCRVSAVLKREVRKLQKTMGA